MRYPPRSLVGLAAAVLLFAGCTTSGSSLAPLVTSDNTAAPPAAVTPSGAPPAGVDLPPAPTNFTAKQREGVVPCPSPADASCSQTDLAWQSDADASTWFRIYATGASEGPGTCAKVQGMAEVVLETKPGARSAQLFQELATGGGETCLWIAAVNAAGESVRTAAPEATGAPEPPPVPTNFTVTHKQGSVPCPSAPGSSCSQTDLSWKSNADASTWFFIYQAWTGEGPTTCGDVESDAELVLDTDPGARSAQLFNEIATGGGMACLWITAVNEAGESAMVAAPGQ
jgi:hypothetical protein